MSAVPTSPDGQPLGKRGVQARQRILEAVGPPSRRRVFDRVLGIEPDERHR